MKIEEIRANAPIDAERYHEYQTPVFPNTIEYAKFVDGVRFIYNQHLNEWIEDVVTEDEQSSSEFKLLYGVS